MGLSEQVEMRLKGSLKALCITWFLFSLGFNLMMWDFFYESSLSQLDGVWKGENEGKFAKNMKKIGMELKRIITKDEMEKNKDFDEYEIIARPITHEIHIYEGRGFTVYVWVDKIGLIEHISVRGVSY